MRHTFTLRKLMAPAAVVALVAAGCSDDDSAGPEVSVAVDDIVDEDTDLGRGIDDEPYGSLLGQQVTVSGDVLTIDDTTAFEIAGDQGGLLVLYPTGLADDVDDGTLVQVSGIVQRVNIDTFDTDFGSVWDNSLYSGYVDRLAVAADEVIVLESDAAEDGLPAGNGQFLELNDSGVDGDVILAVDGNELRITLSAEDLSGQLPHAVHIHLEPGVASECPSMDEADENADDVLTTAEGVPFYGPVQVALTTDGDFSGDSALALDRFPIADDGGELQYERTFDLDQELVDMMAGMQVAVVIHGQDIDESGEYDGDAESSIDPSVPLEATVPVGCATVTLN